MYLSNQYVLFLVRLFIRIKGYKQSSKRTTILLKVDYFFGPSIKMQNLTQKRIEIYSKK